MLVVAELILTLKGRKMKRVKIDKTVLTVGRDPDNDVVIDNPGISRRHATIRFDNDGFVVQDEGSMNGILLNETPVQQERLVHGDRIGVGKFVILFDDPNASAPHDMQVVTSRELRTFLVGRQDPQSTTNLVGEDLMKQAARLQSLQTSAAGAPTSLRTRTVAEMPAHQTAEVRRNPIAGLKLAIIGLGAMVLVLVVVVVWLASK
jgi:pSer/pThr/pTyr-binding forkhead associated (FHA) protein